MKNIPDSCILHEIKRLNLDSHINLPRSRNLFEIVQSKDMQLSTKSQGYINHVKANTNDDIRMCTAAKKNVAQI